jgi:hypothetical protein
MAGVFEWLDTLSTQAGQVLGKAVDAAGAVATAKIEREAERSVIGDTSPVPATSPIQTAQPGIVIDPQWVVIGAGVALAVGLLFVLRK